MFRSILAVLAGIVVLTVTSFAIEAAVATVAPSSKPWVRPLTFAYGFLCVAAGGYVSARIAGRLPIRHAVAMGIVQAGLTFMAMFSPAANHASTFQWIATAVLSVPAAMLGGLICRYSTAERRPETLTNVN